MNFDFFKNIGKRTKYRMYILSLDKDNFRKALDERFSRITPLYILVYTNKQIKGASEITDENVFDELTRADREWLLGCNLVLINETVFNDMNMLKEARNKFYVDFAKQLELVLQEEYGDGRIEK
jgi:hypothetical protein